MSSLHSDEEVKSSKSSRHSGSTTASDMMIPIEEFQNDDTAEKTNLIHNQKKNGSPTRTPRSKTVRCLSLFTLSRLKIIFVLILLLFSVFLFRYDEIFSLCNVIATNKNISSLNNSNARKM